MRARWEGERVPPGLLRLSVGLEAVEDLWAGLARALATWLGHEPSCSEAGANEQRGGDDRGSGKGRGSSSVLASRRRGFPVAATSALACCAHGRAPRSVEDLERRAKLLA